MANLTHYVKQVGNQGTATAYSTTSSTGAELTDFTVPWSDLTTAGFAAGDDVAVLVFCSLGANTTSNGGAFQVGFGSTWAGRSDAADSYARVEPPATSAPGIQYRWLDRRTLVNNENIYFTGWFPGGGQTAYYNYFRCVVLKLGDLTSSDFAYAEATHSGNAPSSFDTSGASISTPAAGDWLFFAVTRWLMDSSTNNNSFVMAINDGTSDIAQQDYEGEDANNDEACVGTMAYKASFGSGVTVRVRYLANAVHDCVRTAIFGLRLDAFEDHWGTRTTNTVTHSVAGTYSTFASNSSYSKSSTGPFITFGSAIQTFSAFDNRPAAKTQIAGSDWPSTNATYALEMENYSGSGRKMGPTTIGYASSLSSGTKNITWITSEIFNVTGSPACTEQNVAAFSLTLAGGSGFTGAGGAGSLALTGQSGSVSAGTTLTGGVGALTISGQSGAVAAGATLPAGAGSLAIAGQSGTVSSDAILSAGAGGLSLSGVAGSLSLDTVVSGGAGSLALTGSAGAFSAAFDGVGGVSSLAIIGVPGDVSADFVGTGGASSVSIAGLSATVSSAAVLNGGTGTLAITGYQSTAEASAMLAGGAGGLSITGLASAVSADAVLAGDVGALTIAGQPGTFSTTGDFAADGGAGSLTITGLSGNVSAEFFGIAGASSVSIAGQAGAVNAGASLAAGAGAIAIDGLAGEALADAILAGDAGALAIEGLAGDVIAESDGDAIVIGGLGELVIEGYPGEVVAFNEWVPGASPAIGGGVGWSGWRWAKRALTRKSAKAPLQDAIKVGRLPLHRAADISPADPAVVVAADAYLWAGGTGGMSITGHPAVLLAERNPDDDMVMEIIASLLPQFFGDLA